MKKLTRCGFTLPEILVTVTVMAVLAAVVVPAVLQFASKGDGPSVLSEINALKKGLAGFVSDTRHYPRTLQQLTTTIASTSSCAALSSTADSPNCDLTPSPYTVAEVALWKGPYFEGVPDATTYTTKALGVVFSNVLVRCGAVNAFICLDITNSLTPVQIALLDKQIDGGNGVAATSTDANATNGSLIWSSSTTPNTIRFKLGVAN